MSSEASPIENAVEGQRLTWSWFDRVGWPWITRLSLLYLLLKSFDEWWLRFPIVSISLAALLVPGWHRSRWTWWPLVPLVATHAVLGWSAVDNHVWLLVYWVLALALAAGSPDPQRSIRISARALVGLVFLFATLWKVGLSEDYRSGDFMRVTILTDSRFADFTRIFTDVDEDLAEQTRRRATRARFQDSNPGIVPLPETDRSIWLAWASSWFIGAVEGWIALAFLAGLVGLLSTGGRSTSRAGPLRRFGDTRDVALLFFAAVTYPFATVVGFGWLLMILGLAQCEPHQWRTKAAYLLATWLILMARYVPIVETVAEWL